MNTNTVKESLQQQGREILLPNAEKWSDVVLEWSRSFKFKPERTVKCTDYNFTTGKESPAYYHISDYCQVREINKPNGSHHYLSINIKLTENAYKAIEEAMLPIAYNTIHFNMCCFYDTDECVIYAEHGSIIGSRPLCIVSLSSIPSEVFNLAKGDR